MNNINQIAKDVKKLSPAGQELIGAIVGVDHALPGSDKTVVTTINLEGLIKNHVKSLSDLINEIRTKREMFNDSFNNNPTYREHAEKVKEASKAKSSVKMNILKQPSVARLDQELKDLKFDYKEKKKTLSDLLLDYKEQTGAQQLELFTGEIVDIQTSAKLVRVK